MARSKKLDTENVRAAATGRWPEILERVAGIPADILDPSREHPCPKCQGDTRFRLVDESAGAVLCSHCFSKKNGDGFAAVGWMLNIGFPDAKERIAEHLGLAAPEKVDPASKLNFTPWSSELAAFFCAYKVGVTEEAMLACGARHAMHYDRKVVALPIIGLESNDPVGWVLAGYKGDDRGVPRYNPKTKEMSFVKSKVTYGSDEAGLLGRHGVERLKTPGLPELVWKVEGISDLLALQAAIPENLRDRHLVVTNPKGSKETPKWQAALVGVCNCNVLHDADEPGQAGAVKWSRSIAAQAADGVIVKNVQLPYPITGEKGKDLRDWLAEGYSYGDLLTLADQWPAVAVVKNADGEAEISDEDFPVQEQILKKLQLEVLYEDEGGAIRVFSTHAKKSSIIKQVERLKKETMVQMCGGPAKLYISKDPDGETTFNMEDVREAIALAASKRRGKSDERGIGIWQGLDDQQNQTDTVVLVGNTEAARWNGDRVLRRIIAPRADGLILDFGSATNDWFKFNDLERMFVDANDLEWRQKAIDDATDFFGKWRWRNPDVDPLLVTGLVLATWVQTIWDWRPLVAFTGESNAGKSFLFNALGGDQNHRGIFGNLAYKPEQPSEAGVRQRIRNTAVAVLLDEIEDSPDRNRILRMLRTSTRGGFISKGTGGSQRGIDFIVRHIVWTSAIESGLHGQADLNRYIQFELMPAEEGQGGKLVMPKGKWLHDLGQRLLAIAARSAVRARQIAASIKDTQIQGISPRTIESFSVPVAMLTAIEDKGEEDARKLLDSLLRNVDRTEQGKTDQAELFDAIMTASVHLDGRTGIKTVNQVLESPGLRMDYGARLEAAGVKLLDDYSVFIAPKLVAHQLLKGTPWERMRIDQILMRLKGTRREQLRVGGRSVRGLVVPADIASITEAIPSF